MQEKLRVLLVDDEVEIQKCVARYISFFIEDVSLIFASSFKDAGEKIETLRPHITIADVNLPDGNGLNLIKPARKYSPSNQVIIVTGASDLSKVVDALEFGAIDYLKKPLDMDLLKTVVSEAVSRYRRWYELIRVELKSKQTQLLE